MMLKFKSPVWESRARMSGEIFSNTGLGMLWIEPALKGGANVVINLSGDNARLLQAFGDKQMVDQVLIRLHAFYPQARGAFTGYEVALQHRRRHGRRLPGLRPGQISKYWRLWERPVQRITFAGEHTDALYPGTLEGALRSGQRAASQVQDLAAGKSFDPAKAAPAAAAAGRRRPRTRAGSSPTCSAARRTRPTSLKRRLPKLSRRRSKRPSRTNLGSSRLFGGATSPR
jgi:monoamine oxidase